MKTEKLTERIYSTLENIVMTDDGDEEKADDAETDEEIDASSGVPLSKAEELQSTIFDQKKDIKEIENSDMMTSYPKSKDLYQEQLKIPISLKIKHQLFSEIYRITRDTLIKQSYFESIGYLYSWRS